MTEQNPKFHVGDRVCFSGRWGTVKCLSIGWNPERYRVKFDNGNAMWIDRDSLEEAWNVS